MLNKIDIDFFKNILNKRMSFIVELGGCIYKPPCDDILNNLDLGCYEIIWLTSFDVNYQMASKKIIKVEKLKSNTYKIDSGKIIIDGKVLNSSQFVEFSLKDLRDYKINTLLSN